MLLSHVCIPGTISAWNERIRRWTSRILGREAGHSSDHKGNDVIRNLAMQHVTAAVAGWVGC